MHITHCTLRNLRHNRFTSSSAHNGTHHSSSTSNNSSSNTSANQPTRLHERLSPRPLPVRNSDRSFTFYHHHPNINVLKFNDEVRDFGLRLRLHWSLNDGVSTQLWDSSSCLRTCFPQKGVNVRADSCLGGLVVMMLIPNARDQGSIPCWGTEFFRRNLLLH